MLSVDLLSYHKVFDAVSHSVCIAKASVTLFVTSSVFTVFILAEFSVAKCVHVFTMCLCLSMDVKTH